MGSGSVPEQARRFEEAHVDVNTAAASDSLSNLRPNMTSEYQSNEFEPRSREESASDSTSIIRRSWQAVTELFAPSSSVDAVSLPTGILPRNPEGVRQRSTRADRIPEIEEDEDGQRPTVPDYHSINAVPPRVRVPKKIATPIQVEGKVWRRP